MKEATDVLATSLAEVFDSELILDIPSVLSELMISKEVAQLKVGGMPISVISNQITIQVLEIIESIITEAGEEEETVVEKARLYINSMENLLI